MVSWTIYTREDIHISALTTLSLRNHSKLRWIMDVLSQKQAQLSIIEQSVRTRYKIHCLRFWRTQPLNRKRMTVNCIPIGICDWKSNKQIDSGTYSCIFHRNHSGNKRENKEGWKKIGLGMRVGFLLFSGLIRTGCEFAWYFCLYTNQFGIYSGKYKRVN